MSADPGSGRPLRSWLGDWLPLLAWIGVIVGLSSPRFSAAETRHVVASLLRWLIPDLEPETLAWLLFAVRKLAHMIEYGVLALLAMRAFGHRLPARAALGGSLALAFVVAVLDELHQGWLPSRTGSPRDVLIDLTGAVLALLLLRSALGRWPRSARAVRG